MKGKAIRKKLSAVLLLIALLFVCSSFRAANKSAKKGTCGLTSINLIDRNGMSETISNPDRLNHYKNCDFLGSQPYQKVLRVFERDKNGNILSIVTSYHPNGQLNQYLEVLNSRASGKYQEWNANGTIKLDSNIIGGVADITPSAGKTWLFEGCNRAWDENGNLQAEILYKKGELEGFSTYFHPNGKIWKKVPFHKNAVEGTEEVFLDSGELFQVSEYTQGSRDGMSIRYWQKDKIAAEEEYSQGLLQQGKYFDIKGKQISEIKDGNGLRAIFGKEQVVEMHEYQKGMLSGEIKVFTKDNQLKQVYHVKDQMKNGEEIEYHSNTKPKLVINWVKGTIQGVVKTWYENGTQESQREMSENLKNGHLTAWYKDSSLMMIEEYDHGKLQKGEYYKKGERTAVSQVEAGSGVATIYDADGNFIRKVNYKNGKPSED